LNRLELRPDGVYVGAATPLNKLVASPLLQQHAPALVDACGLIGGPQVRNTATLGGNVAHALPAGDGTIAALALDAQAELADGAGRRFVPLEMLFLGPGRSALDARREVLVGFLLPRRAPGQGSAHRRVMRPQGVAIAILNMAVWLERRQERIAQVRVALGPAGPRPLRARAAEAALLGKAPEAGVIADAVQALLGEASFRTSPHRATAEYRRSVAAWLLEQTLLAAWERAAAGAQD
jgi:carbon-monoxide dehydrogenase medium subunit